MYKEIAKSVFRMQNFFDELTIIDNNGIIQYCKLCTSDTYSFTADEITGRHLFEVYPSSNEDNSEIYQVLKTGKPVALLEENFVTYGGDIVKGYSSTYPLYQGHTLIGAAYALKLFDKGFGKEFIEVQHQTGTRTRRRENYSVDDLITVDPEMIKLKEKIKKVSAFDSAVLIDGQTGTGKEIVAQSLHYTGPRSEKPFISQNCSAIPDNLLESILFGTEKGSYTGAVTNKGLFEVADGGTLFLDEINSMDIHLQAKILKAIEDQSIRRIGGHINIDIDVRVIAAINEEPFTAMKEGRLRRDLFYRLSVISFHLPTLAERKGDIKRLSEYYIHYFNTKYKMQVKGLSKEAERLFEMHTWEGNARELRNIIEGAFAVSEADYIMPEDLPSYIQNKEATDKGAMGYQEQVEAFERKLLADTIARCSTKTEAAKTLGLTKQALNYRLAALHMK